MSVATVQKTITAEEFLRLVDNGMTDFTGPEYRGVRVVGEVRFGSRVIESVFCFGTLLFESTIYFGSATFKAEVFFRFATFKSDVFFYFATFKAGLFLDVVTFKNSVYFDSATFECVVVCLNHPAIAWALSMQKQGIIVNYQHAPSFLAIGK